MPWPQVGLGAPKDFVEFLTELAGVHDSNLQLDEARGPVPVEKQHPKLPHCLAASRRRA